MLVSGRAKTNMLTKASAISRGDVTMGTVKSQHHPTAPAKSSPQGNLKSGLPGTPEEQDRGLRAAMKKHAETLRRLAR
jgi:hypothetical protein